MNCLFSPYQAEVEGKFELEYLDVGRSFDWKAIRTQNGDLHGSLSGGQSVARRLADGGEQLRVGSLNCDGN